jgi:hypothetical protein
VFEPTGLRVQSCRLNWCGIAGRTGMYHVAERGGRVCIVWQSGEDGYVLCGRAGRKGMNRVAEQGGWVCIMWQSGEDGYVSCGRTGGWVCIVWQSGEEGYESCGIARRMGMYRVA